MTIVDVVRSEKQSAQLQQGCHAVPRGFFWPLQRRDQGRVRRLRLRTAGRTTQYVRKGIGDEWRCSLDGSLRADAARPL